MDLGPVHVFWCFSFERFNGILGATHLNGSMSIEIQLMRKLLAGRYVWNAEFPKEFSENFVQFFDEQRKTVIENFNALNATKLFNAATCYNLGEVNWSDLRYLILPNSYKLVAIDSDDLQLLLSCYKVIYPHSNIALSSLALCARKYPRVSLGTETFGSKMDNRNLRSSRILASWSDKNGNINPSADVRPGQVNFFIKHCVEIDNVPCEHVFACICWYSHDESKDHFKKPIQVWKLKTFDNPGPSIYLPVQRIMQTFACCESVQISGEKKLIISPIPRLYY